LCTGWRRLIGSPKLQIIFHKRATKYRALLLKMTYKDKGSYESSPPCTPPSFPGASSTSNTAPVHTHTNMCGHICVHVYGHICVCAYMSNIRLFTFPSSRALAAHHLPPLYTHTHMWWSDMSLTHKYMWWPSHTNIYGGPHTQIYVVIRYDTHKYMWWSDMCVQLYSIYAVVRYVCIYVVVRYMYVCIYVVVRYDTHKYMWWSDACVHIYNICQ